jgi:hypothetical protein
MSTESNHSNRWKPWLLAGGSPVPPVSGDALLAVPNIAALMALPTATIDDGGVVSVKSVMDMFMLDKTSVLVPDGITVVAALGGGNWLRLEVPSQKWILQPTWYIDPVAGNDENDGFTAVTPLQTFAEWKRRVGQRLEVAQTLNIQSDIAEDMVFDHEGTIGVYVVVQGFRTVLYSGAVTAQQPWQVTPPVSDGQITDAAIPVSWTASGLVDKMVVKTSGVGVGSCGWIAKDMGAKAARYSPLIDANTFTVYDWSVGETFDVVDLTKVSGNFIVTDSAQVIPIDLHFMNAIGASSSFITSAEGLCFPIYCEIETSFTQCIQGGYVDYIGCRIAPDTNRLYCSWSSSSWLDACLVKARITGEEDGVVGVLRNSLAQGVPAGTSVGVLIRNTQTEFTVGGWYAVYDQPTADPALYADSGSSVRLNSYLWGNGGASNYAIVLVASGLVEYPVGGKPFYGPVALADTNVGGLLRPYASLPVHNLSKACGIVQL